MSVVGRLLAIALLPAGLWLGVPAASAAAPQEQLVYWPVITDGTEYRRVAYPQEAGSLLVLADTEIVIEARYAPVSFWPITRQYLADFAQQRQPVEGKIEIVDRSGKVTVVEPEPYLMWYPKGVGAGPSQLVRGEEVAQFYQDYVRAARAAAEMAQEYQRIVAEQDAAVAAWLRMAAEGRKNMPAPPPELDLKEPEPFLAYASEPREAAVISLTPGTFTVRVRGVDNEVVPGSVRELVSFGPLSRAIGYVLRPEDRWTRPMVSFAPQEAIYTTGRTDLFLQPVPVVEYEAHRFSRLFRPQSVEAADPSLTVWVPTMKGGAGGDAVLALWNGETLVDVVPRKPYRVAQIAGTSRGYVISEFAPQEGSSLRPDFTAMRVDRQVPATRVSLLDAAGDKPVGTSERRMRRVTPPPEWLLFLPALVPLTLGLALRARRLR